SITAQAPAKEYGTSKAVLFHNGHWSGYERFAAENRLEFSGPVSDSRVAAVGAFLAGREFVRTLPGRYVIFSSQGLERFGDWTQREGMHFSNLNWMPVRTSAAKPAEAPAKAPKVHKPYTYTGPSKS